MTLESLAPLPGSRKTGKRLGRGESSGLGKTSGKGNKGQLARSGGKVPAWFEGGQMPLYRRIRKVGFRSRKIRDGINQYQIVNVAELEKFESGTVVDEVTLASIGLGPRAHKLAGTKILGNGELTKKLTVKVQAISQAAQAKIEKAGGTVEIVSLSKSAVAAE
ncbi:MAG: 50S ribosomal protein L15 [Bdellovibrionales bacterium]|nr:50S ribosomal protein L15 [Bdellovibrionales bacterium]